MNFSLNVYFICLLLGNLEAASRLFWYPFHEHSLLRGQYKITKEKKKILN